MRISTVDFRQLEPHLLTVSSTRNFEDQQQSEYDGDSTEVAEDENSLPIETQPRVVICGFSIKLWDCQQAVVSSYLHVFTMK